MNIAVNRPEAIIVGKETALRLARPEALKRGVDRLTIVARWAEAILGARAYIRKQHGQLLYITRCPLAADSLLFPIGHVREGQSRYRWERQPDDSLWGWLVEGADDVYSDSESTLRMQARLDEWLLKRQIPRKP